MKFKFIFLSLLATIFIASAASADAQWCGGKITHVWVNKAGNLYIYGTWRNDHTQICNIKNSWNNVEPELCKSWLSIALASKMANTDVTVQYADAPSCETIPKYESAPSPEYIMTR